MFQEIRQFCTTNNIEYKMSKNYFELLIFNETFIITRGNKLVYFNKYDRLSKVKTLTFDSEDQLHEFIQQKYDEHCPKFVEAVPVIMYLWIVFLLYLYLTVNV